MFIVECATMEIYKAAKELLDFYKISHGTRRVVDQDREVILLTTLDINENDDLAEMCFQGNWHQKKELLCGACKAEIEKTGEGSDSCGHLTFIRPIDSSAFDNVIRLPV